MSKKEEFKNFVSQNPTLIDLVASKKHTWQELYELYDLYGSDKTSWNKYLNFQNTNNINMDNLNEIAKMFKNVNLESVQKYINTAQKALAVIEQLSLTPEKSITGPLSKVPINKIFED